MEVVISSLGYIVLPIVIVLCLVGTILYSVKIYRIFKFENDKKFNIKEEVDDSLIYTTNQSLKDLYGLHLTIINEFSKEFFQNNVLKEFNKQGYESTVSEFNKFKVDFLNEYNDRYSDSILTKNIIKLYYNSYEALLKDVAFRFDSLYNEAYANLRNTANQNNILNM